MDLIKKSAPGITFSSPEAREVYRRIFKVRAELSLIRGVQVSWFQLLSEMVSPYERDLATYENQEKKGDEKRKN